MNQEKVCKQCKKKFVPKRSDAVFCGPTCRWNSWREKKGDTSRNSLAGLNLRQLKGTGKPDNNPLVGLKGVIEIGNKDSDPKGQEVKSDVPAPVMAQPATLKVDLERLYK